MRLFHRYTIIFFVTISLSLLIVSCSESKQSQCKKLIDIVNNAVNETKVVTNSGQNRDNKTLLQTADTWEKASKEMELVKVNDEKLKEYQSSFIKMYKDTVPVIRNLATALQNKERATVISTLKTLKQTTSPEPKLVAELNSYCSLK